MSLDLTSPGVDLILTVLACSAPLADTDWLQVCQRLGRDTKFPSNT